MRILGGQKKNQTKRNQKNFLVCRLSWSLDVLHLGFRRSIDGRVYWSKVGFLFFEQNNRDLSFRPRYRLCMVLGPILEKKDKKEKSSPKQPSLLSKTMLPAFSKDQRPISSLRSVTIPWDRCSCSIFFTKSRAMASTDGRWKATSFGLGFINVKWTMCTSNVF